MRRFILIAFIVIMLFSSKTVFACFCAMSDDPIESFKTTEAVFVGKVISIKDNMDIKRVFCDI